MVAIFPKSQARILDYNRLIKDLYGYSSKDLIKEIKKKFSVEKQNSSFKPKKPQTKKNPAKPGKKPFLVVFFKRSQLS